MKPAQLLFEHQRLVDRERILREDIERVTSRLESDPEVVDLEASLAEARGTYDYVGINLYALIRIAFDLRHRRELFGRRVLMNLGGVRRDRVIGRLAAASHPRRAHEGRGAALLNQGLSITLIARSSFRSKIA